MYLSSVLYSNLLYQKYQLVHLAELVMDFGMCILNCADPQVFHTLQIITLSYIYIPVKKIQHMIVSKTWRYINHNGFLLDKDGTKYQVLRYI